MHMKSKNILGFTMIELLVVLAILAVVSVVSAFGIRMQIVKSQDARRKDDLAKLKIVLEDYYNDKGCYPDASLLQTCNGKALQPYMSAVPCDPSTNTPYGYYKDASCRWYGLFTTLGNTADTAIASMGCSPTCGILGKTYNYAVANGSTVVADIVDAAGRDPGAPRPTASPTPLPTVPAGPDFIGCGKTGECQNYSSDKAAFCTVQYADYNSCAAECSSSLPTRCSIN